jgi:hypothetical protein
MNRKIIAIFFVLLAPFSFAYADLKTDIEAGVDSSETLNNEVAALMESDPSLTPAAAKQQAETNMVSALVSLGMTESAAGAVVSRVAVAVTVTDAPLQVVTIPDAVIVKQLVKKAVAVVAAANGLIGSGSEDATTILESLTVPGLSDFLASVIANDPILLEQVTVLASLSGGDVAQLFTETTSIY